MLVEDIMSRKVITLDADTPVQEIARVFREHGISGAPVLEDGRLVGIVTGIDLIARHARIHYPRYLPFLDARIPLENPSEYKEMLRRVLGTTARDIKTKKVVTIPPDADLEELATVMVERKVNPVPVVDDDGNLVGIVSHADVLRVIEELEGPSS
jgi:CBS domain-containing protein